MRKIDNTITHIGSKIKYYRLLNKISLSKLATEANISKSTLFGLEEGRSNPTISTLINIATTLNIDLNELIGNELSNSEISSQLTLISMPQNEDYKLYKLSLTSNELFILKEHSNKKLVINLLDGKLNLIDNSLILHAKESVTVKNSIFKAGENGAVAFIKIFPHKETLYLKNDLFYDKVSEDILNTIAKKSTGKLITRVIFNSIAPIKEIKSTKYINYIESIEGKESHYYFYRRYLGLIGALKSFLKKIHIHNSKISNLEEFINKATYNNLLDKNDYNKIDLTPLEYTKNIIEISLKEYDSNIIKINSIFELYEKKLDKNSKFYLLEDFIGNKENHSSITLVILIYRAIEALYTIKENNLNSNELKLFYIIITNLPKALYYSYYNYNDIAIKYINEILLSFKDMNINDTNTKIISNYLSIINMLKNIKHIYKEQNYFLNENVVEYIAKDMNLDIEVKELISPVIENSGLYCYVFKPRLSK